MKKTNATEGTEHRAFARALNLTISTKSSIEISNFIRYKNTSFAKSYLEEVVALKKAIPFKRFNRDMGHKPGMAAGRFPKNAAAEFLKLIKSVESNAQMKGLDLTNLKISQIIANKAAVPLTGGRNRHGSKRTHLKIEVKEGKKISKSKKDSKKEETKEAPKKDVVKESVPVESGATEKTLVEPKVENKEETKETKEKVTEEKTEIENKENNNQDNQTEEKQQEVSE